MWGDGYQEMLQENTIILVNVFSFLFSWKKVKNAWEFLFIINRWMYSSTFIFVFLVQHTSMYLFAKPVPVVSSFWLKYSHIIWFFSIFNIFNFTLHINVCFSYQKVSGKRKCFFIFLYDRLIGRLKVMMIFIELLNNYWKLSLNRIKIFSAWKDHIGWCVSLIKPFTLYFVWEIKTQLQSNFYFYFQICACAKNK